MQSKVKKISDADMKKIPPFIKTKAQKVVDAMIVARVSIDKARQELDEYWQLCKQNGVSAESGRSMLDWIIKKRGLKPRMGRLLLPKELKKQNMARQKKIAATDCRKSTIETEKSIDIMHLPEITLPNFIKTTMVEKHADYEEHPDEILRMDVNVEGLNTDARRLIIGVADAFFCRRVEARGHGKLRIFMIDSPGTEIDALFGQKLKIKRMASRVCTNIPSTDPY